MFSGLAIAGLIISGLAIPGLANARCLQTKLNVSQERWIARRNPPCARITLGLRNIYIIPSRNGLLYLLSLGLIFIAAINYAASLAFGLAFLMVSMFILAILYCFNNLSQLTLSGMPAPAVFCGEEACFKVLLSRAANNRHEALLLNFPDRTASHVDLMGHDQDQVDVFALAGRRGRMQAPRLRVTTYYPLGLTRAWAIVDLDMHCIVYPKPVPHALDQFTRGASGSNDSAISKAGTEDYYGLRDYIPGDSLRQMAWKNVARGQGTQVKQFVDYVDSKLWLDWDMFYGFNTEERLSRLCYCVLKLARGNNSFGMKIPGVEISPATGLEHRNRMLKALALFGQGEVV